MTAELIAPADRMTSFGAHLLRLAFMAIVDGRDRLAVGRSFEMTDLSAGHELDVVVLQARRPAARSRRPSCRRRCWETRPSRVLPPFSQASMSTPSGSDAGCRPRLFSSCAGAGDRRLVGNGRKGVGLGVIGLGRIVAERAAHVEKLLGLRIPRLEFVIGDGPGRRDAAEMLHLRKIFLAVADQHRAVELRIAADIVVVAGIEALAAGLAPHLLRPEMAAPEDRARCRASPAVG